MQNTCKFRGGIRKGTSYLLAANYTWPFAVMEITNESICLSAFATKYVFDAGVILAIKKYDGMFSKGIQIEHNVDSIPKFVVFWTFQREAIIKCLIEHGYRLD